ncbi:MAG TPA: PAS domain S-box protein, partial [Acetobacteraceae bacterium]|nr:PAS domain S-box protein [Acetobacteraceae bacterium]
ARVRQLLAGEIATYGMEKRYIRKDGAPLWVNLTVSLLRDGAGTPQQFISVIEDISPRKAIEATLRAFYEVSPLLMGTVELLDDGDLLHRYDNPATNRFFGAAPGSTHGRTARALGLPEATIAEWRARYEEAAARDGSVSFECGYDAGPAPPRRLAVTVAPLGTGPEGQQLFCYVAEDVTARRAAEAALAESEARFRAITEAMPQMVWSARPDGYTDFFNRRWYDMTGAAPDSLRGDTWHLLAHPDDGPAMLASWREAASRGQPYEVEYRLRMADGRHRWVLARALPVRDANGRVTRWFGTCTDIEDIRRAREVLARDRAELEQLVQERTLELQRAQARLAWAEKMTALGQLAGGVAHDFNNVMQTVAGAAGLIRRRPGDAAAVDRYAGMIENAAERGTSVTRRLLAFARRGELQAGPVEVAGLLEGLREVLAHTLGVGVAIRLDVAAALPPVLADRGQLETALINLATNARDAMPAGGTLTLSAARETVADGSHPEGLAAGAYVRIGVSDSGTGMDAATLARVMEPFFTTKPRGQGTGLGLPMARGFAEQSGGALALASAAGRGTTVTLWLPVAASAVGDGGTAARAAPPARAAAPRILLVEDDDPVREVLAAHLAGHGYDVAAAPDGAAALALLDSGAAPDLLVSDLAMPGMDGLALIREAQRRRAALPAILLTGYAGDAAPLPAGGADADRVTLLRKPVSGAHLAERVAMLLAATPHT